MLTACAKFKELKCRKLGMEMILSASATSSFVSPLRSRPNNIPTLTLLDVVDTATSAAAEGVSMTCVMSMKVKRR